MVETHWRNQAVAVFITAILVLLAGCSTGDVSAPPKAPGNTVVAEIRDIVSVVVVDGTVEARPVIVVAAPHGGTAKIQTLPGTDVESGTELGTIGGDAIVSPVRGAVTDVLIDNHNAIAANVPVLTITYAGFGVRIVIPPEQLFRLYEKPTGARVNVTGGPAGLECVLAPGPIEAAADGAPVYCLIPLDAEVVPGLPAKVGVTTGRRDSVVALPVSAVSGSAGQGVVTVVRGEERASTKVRLGITDGAFIEILDGIQDGDVVLKYAPVLE